MTKNGSAAVRAENYKAADPDRRCVAVIGGGAGGLAAAAAAARLGAAVVILEKNDRVGKKLLRTGNGRCNLSHLHLSAAGYNHPDFVAPVLERFSCAALRAHFEDMGLWTVADHEGRVYPASDTAASALDVLRLSCAAQGVKEHCSFDVVSLRIQDGGFVLHARDGGRVTADAVIDAAGGGSVLAEALGHRRLPFSPALCPIRTETALIRGLSGLRAHARAALFSDGRELASETGEILFRDYGVSGIPAFDLSRLARPGQLLCLDFTPELSFDELLSCLITQLSLFPDPAACLTGVFRRRLAEALLRAADDTSPGALCRAIKDLRLPVLGLAETGQAQLTAGGADVAQFNPATLESRLIPGFYTVGEALDIDGRCGGYNLHWAFASGITAGEHAAGGNHLA